MTLILRDVTKSFLQGKERLQVIKNANLEIKKGEVTALVGPSGSGKTTLLQIAGLLDNPDSGEIVLDGINLSIANDEVRTKNRRENIGFIYQFHHLLPEFSALENIAIPLLIRNYSWSQAFSVATEMLAAIDLTDRASHRPSELSGGQQQRVAVARALVGKPEVLLADEPTGNLDSENANRVFDLLMRFSREFKIAALIVTHNSELAARMDHIINIKDGILS